MNYQENKIIVLPRVVLYCLIYRQYIQFLLLVFIDDLGLKIILIKSE